MRSSRLPFLLCAVLSAPLFASGCSAPSAHPVARSEAPLIQASAAPALSVPAGVRLLPASAPCDAPTGLRHDRRALAVAEGFVVDEGCLVVACRAGSRSLAVR